MPAWPYASVPDVEALNRSRSIGVGAGQPTKDDVLVFLEMVAGEIDSILLNKGYSVPVNMEASPVAARLLRSVNALGAIVEVEKSAPSSPKLEEFQAEYDQALEKLRSAELTLDASLSVERSRPRGPGLNSPRPAAIESRPFFDRDMLF